MCAVVIQQQSHVSLLSIDQRCEAIRSVSDVRPASVPSSASLSTVLVFPSLPSPSSSITYNYCTDTALDVNLASIQTLLHAARPRYSALTLPRLLEVCRRHVAPNEQQQRETGGMLVLYCNNVMQYVRRPRQYAYDWS